MVACGRTFPAEVLRQIETAVREEPDLSRAALARRVCATLDWRGPHGRWQAMSCRVALLKLHRRGLLPLPPARRPAPAPRARPTPPPAVAVTGRLAAVGPVELVPVRGARDPLARLWTQLVATEHPLGAGPLVGAQQRYLIRSPHGWLGAVGFSAAAWALAPRDAWIGWSPAARRAHLPRVVCNSRFLLRPGVRVPHLASHVLALCAARLPQDWQARYGVTPLLLETFVPRGRGTCYRAANWVRVGPTQGRGRQDRAHARAVPVKDIYCYPLRPDWRAGLGAGPAGPGPPRRPPPAAQDWAAAEFGAVALGDRRLHRRVVRLARAFYARPQANLPQACGSRAATQAAYRFFAHEAVTLDALLAPHAQATLPRLARQAIVLAVQDTTSLDYTTQPTVEGLGPIGSHRAGPVGLLVHSTLAVTPAGLPLGLLDVQVWARDPATFGKRHRRYAVPVAQKESVKWLRSFQAAARVQAQVPGTTVVSVGDREADLYELFVAAVGRPDQPHLLVRATRERVRADGQGPLWASVAGQAPAGTHRVLLPRRPGQRARVAELEVRFATVTLRPPKRKRTLPPVRVAAIQAREVAPPAGVEPVQWLLLTTLEVASVAQATEKLDWYTQRWTIEVFHRTLKSGCRIEDRQLSTAGRLENCLALDLVVAWRIVHLTMLGRETPAVPCTVAFEDVEWQALYGFVHRTPQLPPQPPTLREAVRMVAGLGGFLGRKGDGEPGTQTLWRGLQDLAVIVEAWRIFSAPRSPPSIVS